MNQRLKGGLPVITLILFVLSAWAQSALGEESPTLSEERIMGDITSPLKITIHSSFSCRHCAKLYTQAIPFLKTTYIDTGKAYLVFSDFPLNAPALHASMAARCVGHERYFEFVNDLFSTQLDWAYEENYLALLKGKAKTYGLSASEFESCVRDDALQTAILTGVKGTQQNWNLTAVPTLIVNDSEKITFASTTEDYRAELAAALSDY